MAFGLVGIAFLKSYSSNFSEAPILLARLAAQQFVEGFPGARSTPWSLSLGWCGAGLSEVAAS